MASAPGFGVVGKNIKTNAISRKHIAIELQTKPNFLGLNLLRAIACHTDASRRRRLRPADRLISDQWLDPVNSVAKDEGDMQPYRSSRRYLHAGVMSAASLVTSKTAMHILHGPSKDLALLWKRCNCSRRRTNVRILAEKNAFEIEILHDGGCYAVYLAYKFASLELAFGLVSAPTIGAFCRRQLLLLLSKAHLQLCPNRIDFRVRRAATHLSPLQNLQERGRSVILARTVLREPI